MKPRISFAALTAFGFALVLPAAAQLPAAYTISDLGVIPATPYPSSIADVTRTRYALQGYTNYPGPPAYLENYSAYAAISQNGAILATLNLGLPNVSYAKKINDSGTITVHTHDYNPRFHEYLLAAPYSFGSSNTYGGYADTSVNDINSRGQAAVTTAADQFTTTTATTGIWSFTQGSARIDLALPGDSDANVNGISENGLLAGASGQNYYYQFAYNPPPNHPLIKHALVWTPTTPNALTGTVRALTPLQAGDNSEAFAVNDLGEAVGTSGSSNVYWNANGAPKTLTYGGRSINNKSEILLSGNLLGMASGATHDPTALIANPAGWSALSIYKLYNDGALVGTGQLNGATHIFLLAPVPVSLSGNITLEGATHNGQTVTFTFRPTNGAAPTVLTTTLGANGAYALNVPPDNYSLLIHADKYLQVAAPLNIAGSQTASLSAFLPAGDANADNRVDVLDFGILVDAYGSLASDPASGYDANADFNDDGSVDVADFGLLVNSYGENGAI